MELYNDLAKRRRIANIRAIVLDKIWSLNYLKKMSDPIKAYYAQGRAVGISHGVLLTFHEDIYKFK